MEGITKVFPGVRANDRINIEVLPGEIHALLGENGAGKSTLINILTGLARPDEGRILLDGQPVEISSARAAIDLGIGVVHQHFMLVPTFSVVQNVALGLYKDWNPDPRLEGLAGEITAVANRLGVELAPWAVTETLPLGTRQKVEILKALHRGARLLVLDEPTAVLVPQEVTELFATLRSMVESGLSVIFITHKMEEVMAVCDRVTVLREGRVVGTWKSADTSPVELAERMVGRKVAFHIEKKEVAPGKPLLEIEDLTVEAEDGRKLLDKIDLTLREGEIVGIAGVDGNGQRELMEVLFGLRRPVSGGFRIEGREASRWSPRDMITNNIGRIPEDRQGMGLIMDMTIGENLILERFRRPPFSRKGFLDRRSIRKSIGDLIQRHDIRPPVPEIRIKNLSGGNQQKVIVARELLEEPKVLIAVNPTRGLDVGATEFVHQTLLRCRERGSAILLISSELREILSLSDRIAALYEGRIQGVVEGQEADPAQLGLWMTGGSQAQSEAAGTEIPQ